MPVARETRGSSWVVGVNSSDAPTVAGTATKAPPQRATQPAAVIIGISPATLQPSQDGVVHSSAGSVASAAPMPPGADIALPAWSGQLRRTAALARVAGMWHKNGSTACGGEGWL